MSGIILTTPIIKLCNKGGGWMHGDAKNEKGEKIIVSKKFEGTDYVVFVCPHCHQRNKQSLFATDYSVKGFVGIKCRMCRGSVELFTPISKTQAPLIITPEEFSREKQKQHGNHPVL